MEDLSSCNMEGTPQRTAQLRCVDMALDFIRVCEENNLTYWIDYGSLLGAVRHGGFIPWDDDMDFSMPSEDFHKFLKTGQSKLDSRYFIQTEKTDPGCGLGKEIFKIRDLNSLLINKFDDFSTPYKKGISIDVFESVDYPTMPKPLFEFFRKWLHKSFGFMTDHKKVDFGNAVRCFLFPPLFLLLDTVWKLLCLFKRKERVMLPIKMIICGYPTLKSEMFPLGCVMFEGHKFAAPGNPHARLTDIYKDYMVLPPVEKRRNHALFICTDIKATGNQPI